MSAIILPGIAAQEVPSVGIFSDLYDDCPSINWTDPPQQTGINKYAVGIQFRRPVQNPYTIREVWVREWATGGSVGNQLEAIWYQGGTLLDRATFPTLAAGSGTEHKLTGLNWVCDQRAFRVMVSHIPWSNVSWGRRTNNNDFDQGAFADWDEVIGLQNTSATPAGAPSLDRGTAYFVNVVVEE